MAASTQSCEVGLVARLVGSTTHSIRHLGLARSTHLNGRPTYSTKHADRSAARGVSQGQYVLLLITWPA